MLDQIATNFLNMALQAGLSAGNLKISVFNNFDLDLLGSMFIPWGPKVKVIEIADGTKISDHEWEQKQNKFNFFKDHILKCEFFDTIIFIIRKAENSPFLIIDGVHRAIGLQKALLEFPKLKDRINLRILLIESINMDQLEDYKKVLWTTGC